MTPKWFEAFGNVAVEAMATGVPVITCDRGGPAEIVVDGQTGCVVPADDVDALVAALGNIDRIDRVMCRQVAEERWSTTAMAGRVERWLARRDRIDAGWRSPLTPVSFHGSPARDPSTSSPAITPTTSQIDQRLRHAYVHTESQ